jgi:hypothetical protein
MYNMYHVAYKSSGPDFEDTRSAAEAHLTQFVKFLGHERFAIKSVQTGKKGAQEAHFDLITANKAVDYIKLRNGKRQLWVNVNRLKRDSKKFHDFDDVEAVTNIFIDVDAKKPDDKKDFAATEKERGFALAQLPTVQKWLSEHTFKPGLAFKSGNGAGLLLPIPPTPPTPEFIAKVAAFLKVVRREANVDVDTATFDPTRVCGVLGTWNSKLEDEDEGRKNHVREAIGDIPTRDEDARLLRFIEELTPDPDALREWTKKFNSPPTTEENEPEPPEDAGEVDVDFVKAKLDALSEADTVLLDLLNWTDEAKKRHGKDRSKAEFGLVGKLTAGGFTDPQINWVMTHVSKIGKWSEEGEHYQEVTLRKIRGNNAEEAAGETEGSLEDLKDKIEEDPEKALHDPGILKRLIDLRKRSPITYDRLEVDLRKAEAVKSSTLRSILDAEAKRIASTCESCRDEPEEIPEDVLAEAEKIVSAGRAFEYLYETWQSRHLGDERVGKALLGGFGAQRCSSTEGIHIQVNGPREAGKSHAVETATDLLPPRLVMSGSMSNMVLFYNAENAPPGAAVSIDDITYTEAFGAVQKRCTTGFQTGATHRSVVDTPEGKGVRTFRTKPRMAFYTTSVDRHQDEQLRSRLWSIDADSSPEHKAEVIKFRQRKDAGELFDPTEEDRKTAVCRAIFEILDEEPLDVIIPFATRLVTIAGMDVRSYNVISDLTKSLAAYRHRVRDKDDLGRILATVDDFRDAKSIFDATEGHSDVKFTSAETKVLKAFIDNGNKATMGDLIRLTKLTYQRVYEILNGRGKGEQKRHGLMSKAPISREQVSDSWTYDYDTETRRDTKRKTITEFVYYLDPSFKLKGYESPIVIGEEDSVRSVKGSVEASVDKNDNKKKGSVVSVVNKKREEDTEGPLPQYVGIHTLPSPISQNATETTETPSPLSIGTTETSPESPRKPQKATETDRVFGLSIPYYLDLGGGQLPTVKALMKDQNWPQDKAVMAIGMLEQRRR